MSDIASVTRQLRDNGFVGPVNSNAFPMLTMPIPSDWVIEGAPETKGGVVCHVSDLLARVVIWQTSAGRFKWHYNYDEFFSIVEGEAMISDAKTMIEHRYGPGDFAIFPAGSVAIWHVPRFVKKIAVVKTSLPASVFRPLSFLRNAKNLGKRHAVF